MSPGRQVKLTPDRKPRWIWTRKNKLQTVAIWNIVMRRRRIMFADWFCPTAKSSEESVVVGIRPVPRSWMAWNFEDLEPVEILSRRNILAKSGNPITKRKHSVKVILWLIFSQLLCSYRCTVVHGRYVTVTPVLRVLLNSCQMHFYPWG